MNKSILTMIGLVALCLGLAVVCLIVLPDTVITQFGAGSNTTMSKYVAVVLPCVLGIGGAIANFVKDKKLQDANNDQTDSENESNQQNYSEQSQNANHKWLLISLVGSVVLMIMLFVNL